MSQVARSSLIVTIFAGIGIVLSFCSSVIIAAKFGARAEMDVFLAATTVPLFINGITSGVVNFSFIPVFFGYQQEAKEDIWRAVTSFLNLVTVFMAVLCVVLTVLTPQVIHAIAPGFDPVKAHRSGRILQVLLPTIVFTGIGEILSSMYYAHHRVLIPSLNKTVGPILTIIFVLVYHQRFNTASLALAMAASSAVQTTLLAIGIFRNKVFHYVWAFDARHPAVRRIGKLMIPLLGGIVLSQSVGIFDRYFLSRLPEGCISRIGYANKLFSVISQLVVTGISVSIFPRLSRYAAEQNWEALSGIVDKGVRMVIFLSVPFLAFFGLFGKDIIAVLLERGKFMAYDTRAVSMALTLYLFSLPAGAAGGIIAQLFYALQKNIQLTWINAVTLPVYIGLCFYFLRYWGYLAIPLSFAIYHCSSVVITSFIIRRHVKIRWRETLHFLGSVGLLAGASVLILFGLKMALSNSVFFKLGCLPTGLIIYLIFGLFWLHLDEAKNIWYLIETSIPRGKK